MDTSPSDVNTCENVFPNAVIFTVAVISFLHVSSFISSVISLSMKRVVHRMAVQSDAVKEHPSIQGQESPAISSTTI